MLENTMILVFLLLFPPIANGIATAILLSFIETGKESVVRKYFDMETLEPFPGNWVDTSLQFSNTFRIFSPLVLTSVALALQIENNTTR